MGELSIGFSIRTSGKIFSSQRLFYDRENASAPLQAFILFSPLLEGSTRAGSKWCPAWRPQQDENRTGIQAEFVIALHNQRSPLSQEPAGALSGLQGAARAEPRAPAVISMISPGKSLKIQIEFLLAWKSQGCALGFRSLQDLTREGKNLDNLLNRSRSVLGYVEIESAPRFKRCAPESPAQNICESWVFHGDYYLPAGSSHCRKYLDQIKCAIVINVLNWIVK
jgi:hypothetical protein